MTTYENALDFARQLDKTDPIGHLRAAYYIPAQAGKEVIYFNGNSLGLQPKAARSMVEMEMKKWEEYAVEGHFRPKEAWLDYHKLFRKSLSSILGTQALEVSVMNSLTVNLHLLMVSFYRPSKKRNKILIEGGAFPSDQYAVASQARFHGFDPSEAIIHLHPRPDEATLRTEDILQKIHETGEELALILFGGVNYYTGQYFDLPAITQAGHQVGARVGFDLAHTIGNIPLALHAWEVDFATWCSYKYLNSSPGGISGIFVHEKHHHNRSLPRFEGWWGHEEATRFQMPATFVPEPNVDAWQLSNAPILLLAAHRAALSLFDEVGMPALRAKSEKLTGFLEHIIQEISREKDFPIQILTPREPTQRGCQLSIVVPQQGKALFDQLHRAGVWMDWREPDVIRLAPVPMYNTFEDVYRFGEILRSVI